jgi:hypothetical protein
VDPYELPLDAEQGFLLSQMDGATDVADLVNLTGLAPERVEALLAGLVRMGAIDPEPGPEPDEVRLEPEEAPLDTESRPEEPEDPETEAREATHRQLFETRLHAQEVDARVAQARQAEEPELSAYCFDPMPPVVAALLENPRMGPIHARLVAAHHCTSAGLEQLGAKAAFAQDGGVRRALLRNPLLPASLYRRLWSPRRLQEQYLVVASREAPEQTRAMARDTLRAAFNQRGAEEKVELILGTEGRCLAFLIGLTIDGHTTALLCRRTYVSTLLIQNIARWSAAPPQLIAHLRKQDATRRNAQLKQMLERHPNAS